VIYTKSGGKFTNTILDGRTSVCCKKLGWILCWSERLIKRGIACFLRNSF